MAIRRKCLAGGSEVERVKGTRLLPGLVPPSHTTRTNTMAESLKNILAYFTLMCVTLFTIAQVSHRHDLTRNFTVYASSFV